MPDDRYEVVLADNPLGRGVHYQVRYQVYCLETGYEDAQRFPAGEERDHWDDRAVHFLVRQRRTGAWIGAMRLVLPTAGTLPVFRIADLDPETLPATPLRLTAEVSRLCVLSRYRRGDAASSTPRGGALLLDGDRRQGQHKVLRDRRQPPDRLLGPEIMARLLCAGVAYSMSKGITDWFFLTNPALVRLLGTMGIDLTPAGPACEHRGERFPYHISVPEITGQALQVSPLFQSLFDPSRLPYRLYSVLENWPLLSPGNAMECA